MTRGLRGKAVIATAVRNSGNQKIGDAAATYSAQVSCPDDCVFFGGGGCYAESGMIGSFVTAPLNAAAEESGASPLDVAMAEAAAVDALEGVVGRPLRLHGVGDCKTDEAARIVSAAATRYMERGGGPVWTYTHAWRTVERHSWGKINVLASCETPIEVLLAEGRGYATAIVVDSFPSERAYFNEEASIIPCPQQTRGVVCTDCRLCMNDEYLLDAGRTIGFAVHGTALAVKKARLALERPDDPSRKLTSRDFIAAYMARTKEWPTPRQVQDGANVTRHSASEMLDKMKEEEARDLAAAGR